MLVECKNVNKNYGKVKALKNINLDSQDHKLCHIRIQRKVICKTEYQCQHHRQE